MAYKKKDIDIIFDNICERITNGESVNLILKDKDMPSSSTFYGWLTDENKTKKYARAKEIYADVVFEDIIAISDGTDKDILQDEDGNDQVNHNVIQRDRLRIDARKWHLSKLLPKKFGDKVFSENKNEHSGEVTITRIVKG